MINLKEMFSNDKSPINAEKTQKTNKALLFLAGFVVLALLMFILGDDKDKKKKGTYNVINETQAAQTAWVGTAAADVKETKSSVNSMETDIKRLNDQNSELRKALNDMKKEREQQQKVFEQEIKKLTTDIQSGKIAPPQQGAKTIEKEASENEADGNNGNEDLYMKFPAPATPKIKPGEVGLSQFGVVPAIEETIETRYTPIESSLTFTNIQKPKKEKEVAKKKERHLIPTGSIIQAVLLSGIDAPTMTAAKSSPLPVLMKVNDLSILPNRWGYNVNECFLLGEGYGDLTAERAYIRINTLSCITDKGEHIDMPFKGNATGEDGKLGLRGEVVTKQSALLARSIIAGFLSGVGEAFDTQYDITTQNWGGGTTTSRQTMDAGEVATAGLARGFSQAANKLADFYLKMADQVAPVIEIEAGREVKIITTELHELNTLQEVDRVEEAKKAKDLESRNKKADEE